MGISASCARAGGIFRCFAVLLATGAHPRKVGFEGEETFRGQGVAYCATCDGGFFTDRDMFVVGGGFAVAEEAIFLTRYARSVSMLVHRSTLSCTESIVEQGSPTNSSGYASIPFWKRWKVTQPCAALCSVTP